MAVLAYGLDLPQLLETFRSLSYLPILGAVAALCSTQLIKSWRWKYLLAPTAQVKALTLMPPTFIGAMADMILPARIGEFVRSHLAGRKHNVSTVTCLATIVVEKFFDILILLAIAGSLVVFSATSQSTTLPQGFARGVSWVLAACVAGAVILALINWQSQATQGTSHPLRSLVPHKLADRFSGVVSSFANGMRSVGQVHNLIPVALLSILLWATYAASNFLILLAFDLQLPLYASFAFLVFQILGVTLPSSPGFVGTYHAAVVAGFSMFDINTEDALSVAIVMHAAFFLPFVLLGFVFLWWENISLSSLWSENNARS